MDELEYIPIDNALQNFHSHLKTHPRTIFSAGFGEGKSYFLNSCKEQFDDCVFITIYPVNYQIAENRDIFDLIKRDILFQLFINDIISPRKQVSEKVAISFFLFNPQNYMEWIIESLSALDYPETQAIAATAKAYKFLRKGYDKFKKFCDKCDVDDKHCSDLWDKIEGKGIYENDVVTQIIRNAISDWKHKNPAKRIILLVEDMDRIDPAHLFRILNVLSAHIDYCYKLGYAPSSESIAGNKFGFDNIVCVLDYDNLRCIYRHFYGENTCWDGYISKFSSKGIFNYSLLEQKANYFYKQISQLCNIDETIIRKLIPESEIKVLNLRTLNACMDDIDCQIEFPKDYNIDGIIKSYPVNLLRFFVILRRFGKNNQSIISAIKDTISNDETLKQNVIPYYFLQAECSLKRITLGEKDRNGYLILYDFSEHPEDRTFKYTKSLLSGYTEGLHDTNLSKLISYMLDRILY